MYAVRVLSFLGYFSVSFLCGAADPSARLAFGQPVDSLRQFPHHVDMIVTTPMGGKERCGGSILNQHWILTSAFCVRAGIRVEVQFRKKYDEDIGSRYFGISVNSDQVFFYPTESDDIALIKVPITLDFSENLSPINISRLPLEELRGRFSVMPGFDERYIGTTWPTTPRTTPIEYTCPPNSMMCTTTTRPPTTTTPYTTTGTPPTTSTVATTPCYGCPLPPTSAPTTGHFISTSVAYNPEDPWSYPLTNDLKYGMFSIVENRVCQRLYKSLFNEYANLCIDTWGDNPNTPCRSDYGSGLVVGWPAKSELVGVYSSRSRGSCDNRDPSIFIFIGKYMGWIESLIHG